MNGELVKIRVELLGEAKIIVAGVSQPMRMSSLGKVLLYLCLENGSSVNRHDLAREVWRDEEFSVSSNRLRVSLNRLRKMLGACLVASRDDVNLVDVEIEWDYLEIERRILVTLDEVDQEVEFTNLCQVAHIIQESISDQLSFHHLSQIRYTWRWRCVLTFRRISELGVLLERYEWVETAFRAGLVHQILDTSTWQSFLVALNQMGRLDEGVREVRRVAREMESVNELDFAVELKEFSDHLRLSGGSEEAAARRSQALAIGETILESLADSPEVMARVLREPVIEARFVRKGSSVLPIVEDLVTGLESESEAWIGACLQRIAIVSSLYDAPRTIELSERLLESPVADSSRGKVLFYYAFALFQVRRWEEALGAIREAQNYYKTPDGFDYRYYSSRQTEGSILWHMGEWQLALELYQEHIDKFGDSKEIYPTMNNVITRSNMAIVEMIFADINRARDYIEWSCTEVVRLKFDALLSMFLPVLGVVRARTGNLEDAIETCIDGMKRTYSRGVSREGQCCLEWVSGVIFAGGKPAEAKAILDWTDQWRQATGHTRSVAELKFVHDMFPGQEFKREVEIDPNESYRNVMTYTVSQLRDIQSSL